MFRAAFHTGYVPSGVLRLTKLQLDGACADDRFNPVRALELPSTSPQTRRTCKDMQVEENQWSSDFLCDISGRARRRREWSQSGHSWGGRGRLSCTRRGLVESTWVKQLVVAFVLVGPNTREERQDWS